ncbi:MAG TPA: hypothetical protein VJT10_05200 [Steroidobacteraceae bacterium]|jgi:hypothetical protein|nr:hypothetical protein [Steroidobacteraceae bacterium]
MFSKVSIFPVALLALGGTQLASAAGSYDEGQWVTTFMAGSSFIQEGSFNPHVQSGVADLGSIDPALSGIAGVSAIDHLQFKDAFRPGPSFGIETGYMVQSNIEPFARLSYSQMRGRDQEIGFLSAPTLDTATPIRGNFDDMTSWALDFGTRYFLSDTGTMRTYVAGYLGATRTDALDAHFHVVGLTASPSEEILPQKTQFDAGVEGGLAWQLSDNAGLSLSVGAQYLDARSEETDAFAPLGINEVRFTDPRWSFPVNLGLNFHF